MNEVPMDTQALQSLVKHGGVVTLPRLTFAVDKPVVLPSGTVIDGTGTVIKAQHSGYVFVIRGAYDVCIRGVEIQGARSPCSSDDSALLGSGIQVEESVNISIDRVRISNMFGRGIVAASNVYNLKIRDCYINDCSISVFLFKGIRHGRIEGCYIFNSRIIGIFVDDGTESDTQDTAIPNEYTIVSGNMVVYGGTSPRNMGVGIGVSGSADTIVSGNIVRAFGSKSRISHGIVLNNGQGGFNQGRRTVVSGNIISDHTGYGLYVMEQVSFVASGNVYSDNGQGDCKIIEPAKVSGQVVAGAPHE